MDVIHQRYRQTDGQTNGRTDGQLMVAIHCVHREVKIDRPKPKVDEMLTTISTNRSRRVFQSQKFIARSCVETLC